MNNIVVDASNIFFRALFVTGGYDNSMTFDSRDELEKLMRKVVIDLSYIIRQTNSTRVVLAADHTSWRKDIEIEENEGYKGQRERAKHINWDNVFSIMNEFLEIADEKGFIISKVEKAEGDDLVALWRDLFLYEYNENVIIISGDKDLRQLVKYYNHKNKDLFSVVFNPFKHGKGAKKLYVPQKFNEWLNSNDETGDIFNRNIDIDKEDFNNLLSSEKIDIEKINGDYIALYKMFCGDDGDNIPAIYTWLNKNGNTTRITNSKFRKILEKVSMSSYKDAFNDKGEKDKSIKEAITEVAKSEPTFDIHERLKRQAKLVVLDPELFPKEIVDEFNKNIEGEIENKKINPESMNIYVLLEGTNYISQEHNKKGESSSESSIFNQFDNINKLF